MHIIFAVNGDIKDHEDTSVDIMETPDTSEHHRPHSVIIIGGIYVDNQQHKS